VSLAHWNQDEEFGGFGGDHAMIPGGYSQVTAALSSGLDIRLSCPVGRIEYTPRGVRVHLSPSRKGGAAAMSGGATMALTAAAAVVTAPLGVLKAGDIAFSPPLPPFKADAIRRLGFGALTKVMLEFEHTFWDTSVDFFGAALPGGAPARGRCFMFWNLQNVAGAPVLACLLAGAAAVEAESESDDSLAAAAMAVLRQLHPAAPPPLGVAVSRWASDPFCRGSYSFVAVGASGDDYKALAAPLASGRLAFAGEHCCREHPDTVGGAMITGVRAANAVMSALSGRDAVAEWAEDVIEWDQGPLPLPDDSGADDDDEDALGGGDDDSDDEDASGDEEVLRGGKGRVQRRPKGTSGGEKAGAGAAMVALPWMERMGECDAALEARRRFYLRLAAADGEGLTALMGAAPDAPARRGLLRHALGLPPALLSDWGCARGGLSALAAWMGRAAAASDAANDKRKKKKSDMDDDEDDHREQRREGGMSPAAAAQLLELCLRVLGRIPAGTASLHDAGIFSLLSSPRLAAHSDPAVRSLAASLAAKYALQRRTGRAGAAFAAAGSGGVDAADAAAGVAREQREVDAVRSGYEHMSSVAAPRVARMLQDEDEALSAAAARIAAGRAAAAAALASGAGAAYWRPKEAAAHAADADARALPLSELPPEAAAALAAAEAAAAAAAAAARAAEAELGAACGGVAPPQVLSFDKFAARQRKREHRAAKKAREAARDAAREAAADAAAAAPPQRGVDRDGVTPMPVDADCDGDANGNGDANADPSSAAAAAAEERIGDLSPRSSKRLRCAVAAYVHGLLKPSYAARAISRESFKSLAVKCTAKVLMGTQLSGGAARPEAFLTHQRKRKVEELVRAAVEKEQRKSGGGGGGGEEDGAGGSAHGHGHKHKHHRSHGKHGRHGKGEREHKRHKSSGGAGGAE
jgi:hypothetical protein